MTTGRDRRSRLNLLDPSYRSTSLLPEVAELLDAATLWDQWLPWFRSDDTSTT